MKVEGNMGSTFGELLRSRRDSLNLTQEELAGRTGLTPQAIGLLERGERRRPHRYTVEKLAEALGLTGQDLAGFQAAARRSSIRRATVESFQGDLPAPTTPLVGREHEATSVARLLLREEVRLLTLTGPGGVGKTRLAVEVAGRSREAFADGVAFVALAPLREATLLPSVLAQTLRIKEVAGEEPQQTLKRHLRARQMLLVLDNLEHLPTAAPVVGELVRKCRQLTVLATSRAPLHLGGEHQFPVPPLPLLDEAVQLPAGSMQHSPALELFRQRAQAVMPTFDLTDTNAVTVSRICQRLDGLPLAIELAAARVKLFPPRALLRRLDRGLQLLTGGERDLPERQRTLRDTVAWSYELLDPTQQTLFRRLAVFAGGCSLEAVEHVCGSEADESAASSVLETLASLVDNSLLVVSLYESSAFEEDEEPRFTMLETIREYALERLTSSGEVEEAQRKHAQYYLTLAEAAQVQVSVPWDELDWLSKFSRIEREHDNLRAAMGWAIQNREVETGARLAIALWWFWLERGYLSDGRRWMETILALDGAQGPTGKAAQTMPARTKAYLIHVAGILAAVQGDYDQAVALQEEAMSVYREMGHKKGVSISLRELGFVVHYQGDYERAVRLHEQSLALAREFGTRFSIAYSTRGLAHALRAQGDLRRARTLLEESLALSRSEEHAWGMAHSLAGLGKVAYEAGEYARALRLYEESLDLARRMSLNHTILPCLGGLARVALAQGNTERAARLCGAAAALREDMGWGSFSAAEGAEHERTVAAAREALGEVEFAAAWAKGHALPLEEAIKDTLGRV